MKIEKVWAMPNGNTFTIKPIKEFVEKDVGLGGVIVDPFANSCKYGTITNDLNPEFETTHHLDALEFLKSLPSNSTDLVLYDPPYSITQASQLYKEYGKEKLEVNVANMKYWALCKRKYSKDIEDWRNLPLLRMEYEWNREKQGFEMTDILIVAHGGSKNDTLCTREVKVLDCPTEKGGVEK